MASMDKSQAVEDVIDGFVGDLTELVRRVAMEAVKGVLGGPRSVSSRATTTPASASPEVTLRESGTPAKAAPPPAMSSATPKASSTATAQAKAIPAGRAPAGGAALSAPPKEMPPASESTSPPRAASRPAMKPTKRVARHPGLIVVPAGESRAAPNAEEAPAMTLTLNVSERPDRQAQVLEAIRSLVRPTAAEIAGHCGLPVVAIHGLFRSSVLSNQVAKTSKARGVEYSLV